MALPNYLAQIKSSGIYRFVWDKSEIAGVPAEILRLVVGYSEKGPFNTPVYISSKAEFKSVFGDVSKKLEKRGVFFHRMALQCLDKGPIIALNLKKFTPFSEKPEALLNDWSEIQWVPSDIAGKYVDTYKVSVNSVGGPKIQTNGSTPVLYVALEKAIKKGSINGDSSDITINGSGLMIKLSAFESRETKVDVTYVDDTESSFYVYCASYDDGKYNMIYEGECVDAVSFNVATSSIVPEKVGVESIYDTTRFWKLDPEAILSATTDNNLEGKEYISITSADSIETSCSVFMRGYKPTGYDVTVANWYASIGEEVPDYFYGPNGENWASSLLVSDFFAEIYVFRGEFTRSLCAAEPLNRYFIIGTDGKPSLKPYIEDSFGNKLDTLTALAADESSNFINIYSGCLLPYFKNQSGAYVSLDLLFNSDNSKHNMMMNLNSDLLFGGDITIDTLVTNGWLDTATFGTTLTKTKEIVTPKTHTTKVVGDKTVVDKYELDITYPADTATDYVKPTLFEADFIEYVGSSTLPLCYDLLGFVKGDRVLYNDKIWTVTNVEQDALEVVSPDGEEYTFNQESTVVKCNHFASVTNTNVKPVYFEGYTYEYTGPKSGVARDKGKLDWHKYLLSALVEYEGIRTGLTSRKDIDYRYIIDTFEGLVDAELHSELSLIAKEKDNAVAFLNFPSMKTFKTCTYASFTDDKGKLQIKYIKEGANKSKAPAVLFSLASEVNGASFASYNTPIIFSDGTVKTEVPSAALVSNNFMDKYLTREPYYVVAGPKYGRIIATGMIGPDYNFTRADLDILEPMGVNCMIYVPRIGTYIGSNQTAKQNPVSALSSLNVRELVIYLQDQIEALLQDYQWEFNTPYLRDLIKAKADTICDRIKNNGGIYEFLNVCDTSNNTDDVIDNEMFVLSTSIEPGRGAGKMIHELTIYRKGGMQSLIK